MKLKSSKLLLLSALLGLVITFSTTSSCSSTDEKTVVRIGYLNITASLPLFIAEEKGFFNDEGITIESIPLATSNQLVDGLLTDNLHCFVEAAAVPVFLAEQKSPGKIKIFAASEITNESPFDALIVDDSSSIKNLKDLEDKKIGVFPGTTATAFLKDFLIDSGVNTQNIVFTPIPPQSQLAALKSGSIDALHSYEPTTTIAVLKSNCRVLFSSVYAKMLSPNPQGVACISEAFLKQHPELAKKVVTALERAMRFMKENPAECRSILQKRLSLDADVASRCTFLYMSAHKDINRKSLQEYADLLVKLGEMKTNFNVEKIILNDE